MVPTCSLAPVAAHELRPCDAVAAAGLRVRGDGFRSAEAYARAGAAYLAASRRLEACPDAPASLLAGRLLGQAGAAFAQAGDFFTAQALLSAAQNRLTAIVDPKLAAAAKASLDLVQNVIAALENLERSSM